MIFRNFVLKNFPFLEDDFDALTDYELFCKMVEYMKKSLEKVKSFQEEINVFSAKLDDFQNYFDNLDVTSEVNAKLDEMAEDGTLENIISQYLELQTTYTYNSIAEMKLATNLVNGSFMRTTGYYSNNDGGGAYYKARTVTNDDVVDDKFIIALYDNTLVAELLFNNELNIKQIGAKGDDTTDDSGIVQYAINKLATNGGNLIFPKATYLFNDTITLPDNNSVINIIGNNSTFDITFEENGTFLTCASVNNYSRITLKDLSIINNSENTLEVNGIYFEKVTERILVNNVRIVGFYDNLTFKNCWNLTFEKLICTHALHDGIYCYDVSNAFNFNSCIITHNTRYNMYLLGRGHCFNQCDISNYIDGSYNYLNGCEGVNFSGCYYEEDNITKGFLIKNSRGVNFNGCYFEMRSNVSGYIGIDINNSYGTSFNSCEFKALTGMNDNSYIISSHDGATVGLNNSDFKSCKKVIYIENSNLSIINNKLDSVTCFITQENHVYARIFGNIMFASDYTACTLPHPEVCHITVNNQISFGNTASRPSGVYTGQQYLNTQTNHLDVFNGSSWITS